MPLTPRRVELLSPLSVAANGLADSAVHEVERAA